MMRPRSHLLALSLSVLSGASMVACSKSDTSPAGAPDAASSSALPTTFGGDRPVEVRVPAGYDASRPAPLLLVLHGYGAGGAINDVYMHMTSIADAKGFLYVSPDGTVDKAGKRFWNANDGCCDFDGTGVDDVGYLTSLVKEITGVYAVDPKRIFVMGHSNGGYMTNRLACDHAETFAAAVSWAGGNWSDAAKCAPSAPIGFLQMHGTADATVPYGPGTDGPTKLPYAGAEGTVATWAAKNGCDAKLVATPDSLHVSEGSSGPDTKISRHEGCKANGAAELWPVQGADHVFGFSPEAVNAIWKFFEDHRKP
ncbi:MAG TPA: PHB depolymerase family esterase [Labilithrix sp.]|nr:PHB depolymerase family esterase [Labilithrix sp.]